MHHDLLVSSLSEIRDAQQAAWSALAGGWEKWDAVIGEQLRPVSDAIIEGLDIRDHRAHLDVASGTGEPGLTIARLAPHGRTVLTDLAPQMLAVAERRAAAQGVAGVETVVCSADDLPFGAATFDSVSVRFGYMFFPDLAAATAEFVRVLRPGGRLAASVWVSPEANPWTSVALQAIATEVALPSAEPDQPGMFRCAAAGQVSALYAAAGLADVREWDVPVELVTGTAEEYWEMASEHMSLAAAALRTVPAPARERIRDRAVTGAGAYARDGKIRVPGLARCIVGTKPAAH